MRYLIARRDVVMFVFIVQAYLACGFILMLLPEKWRQKLKYIYMLYSVLLLILTMVFL